MRAIPGILAIVAALAAAPALRAGGVVYVDADAPAGGDGASWTTAFSDLQSAIDASGGVGEIWIADGVYLPSLRERPAEPRSATFLTAGSLIIRGGFLGVETEASQRDPSAPPSILSGDLGAPGDSADNAFHVVSVASGAEVMLDRVVIVHGLANGPTSDSLAAGLRVRSGATATLIDALIADNTASLSGAGVHAEPGAQATLIRTTVERNTSGGSGGGVFAFGASLYVVGSDLHDNIAGVGGAIASIESSALILSSRVRRNEAHFYGGAVHSCSGDLRVENSLIVGNRQVGSSSFVGAGLHVCNGEATIAGCTIAYNVGDDAGPREGAGIDANLAADIRLHNTIVWGNTSGGGAPTRPAQLRLDGSSLATVARSLVHSWDGAFPSSDTSGFDPRFVDPLGPDAQPGTDDDDLRPFSASRAVDAADATIISPDAYDADGDLDLSELLPFDAAGLLRAVDDPVIADVGAGSPAYVDLGARESSPGPDASLWVGSGDPSIAANWFPASPTTIGALDILGGGIQTSAPWSMPRAVVSRGVAELDLTAGGLTITHAALDALRIGPWVREQATLIVRNGTLAAEGAIIGGEPESFGQLVLDGSGSRIEVEQTLRVQRGLLRLAGGVAAAGTLDAGPEGSIAGAGTIESSVLSAGEFGPGEAGSPATVVIDGTYDQRSNPDGRGALVIDIGSPARGEPCDLLDVSGLARLGGRLEIRLEPGYFPSVGEEFVILRAATIPRRFDVAYLPGFPDDRIMRVVYRDSARGGQEVAVVVESVSDLLNLGAEDGLADLDGDPVAATLGRFNDDALLDLALAIPGPSPDEPGSAVVVFNAGVDGDGQWLGFSGTAIFNVGRRPSAIASAQLDGVNGDDIVVANAGDGDVTVLRNTGFGLAFSRTDYLVGAEPDGLAIADVDLSPGLDIVVLNSGFSLPPSDQATILGGSGGGGFVLSGALTGLRELDDVDPSDVDNDKDLDLIFAGAGPQGSGVVLVYEVGGARGALSFNLVSEIALPEPARRVRVEDLNGDGLPDIVALLPSSGRVAVITAETSERGSPAFAPPALLDIGDDPLWLVLEDLDGDGDPDIGALARDESQVRTVQALRNDSVPGGEVAFAQPDNFQTPSATALTSGDVDGDGVADLVAVGDSALRGGVGDVKVLFDLPPLPGDANGDGVVDFTDLNAVLAQFGQAGPSLLGDVTDDGVVDFSDLNAVLVAFGTSR